MGNSWCSCEPRSVVQEDSYELRQGAGNSSGQAHLMFRKQAKYRDRQQQEETYVHQPTQLMVRKTDDGLTHMYAVRKSQQVEQRPPAAPPQQAQSALPQLPPAELFGPQGMAPLPSVRVSDWVCVSQELCIYVCDTRLSPSECDQLVWTSEQVCRGQYAAYTYAKQTLGCREFPLLCQKTYSPVHRVTHAIQHSLSPSMKLKLDEREPHVVKYDVTKRERQKLDMHTDKSEWTFLIALSEGSGADYEGGGTFFEGLNATVHVQRGHALIFPGKLRHCGQRITKGVRFLLVGFLVDANATAAAATPTTTTTTTTTTAAPSKTAAATAAPSKIAAATAAPSQTAAAATAAKTTKAK